MTDHDCPWVGECQCTRDALACSCGHRNVSHGSTVKQAFVGLGMGGCGLCGCSRFEAASVALFDLMETA